MPMDTLILHWHRFRVAWGTGAFPTSVLLCCCRISLSSSEPRLADTRRTATCARIDHRSIGGILSCAGLPIKMARRLPSRLLPPLVGMLLWFLSVENAQAQSFPISLMPLAIEHDCRPVHDFFRDRPGMIDPPYLYGYYPGERELSAAFWCQKVDDPRTHLLVLWHLDAASTTADGCPGCIEWKNPPRGLSLFEEETVPLDEFRYVADGTEVAPGARSRYRPLSSYYDGVETLFYCHDGRWTFRTRH